MKKILFISLAVVLALSIGLIGCEGEGEGEGEPIPYLNDGYFIQQTIGDVDSFDPAWGYDTASGEQLDYIYETLLWWDGEASATFLPVLATAWTWNASGVQWRFTIRDDVNFHEGGNLTPEDVEYSFERAMVQDRDGGPLWMMFVPLLGVGGYGDVTFADVAAAIEVDGDEVLFNLDDAAYKEPWLQILCGPWASIVDMEWCIANGEWDGTEIDAPAHNNPLRETSYLFDHANGTGHWKLNLWDPAIQTKLEKFDGYWDGSVPFDWVITQVVDEWTNRKLALLNGDADHIYVPRQYIDELEGIDDLLIYTDLPQLALDGFFFNQNITADSPYIGTGLLDGNGVPVDFFTDLDVRKGFAYAFDYDTYLTDILKDEAKQMGSPIIEGLTYYNPSASMYSLCLTAAATHLQAAWGGDVWTEGFKFTLVYNTGNDSRKSAAEILAANLFAINAKFQISVLPTQWSSTLGQIVEGNFPMFLIGWLADYPDPDNFATPFMHSEEGLFAHYLHYYNAEVDAKIILGRYETDDTAREAIYLDLQDLAYEDPPCIFLHQPLGRRYFTKYISGFYFNTMIPGNAGPLHDMSKSES